MSTNSVKVRFPGGKRVDALIGDYVIHTDQSEKAGGSGSAPEPFDLFLASIATCAGIFALNFCEARSLETAGLAVEMHCERDETKKLYTRMSLHVTLPEGFPEKYRGGLVKAVELCTVKRHIHDAPDFSVELVG